jgi:hypothetical protein
MPAVAFALLDVGNLVASFDDEQDALHALSRCDQDVIGVAFDHDGRVADWPAADRLRRGCGRGPCGALGCR